MKGERYPKRAYNKCINGARKRGRPKKHWIDMIREDCKEMLMTLQESTCMVKDSRVWIATIDEKLTHATALPGP